MRLVMTLLVRDEADVVAAMLEHHLAAGVEFVLATDNGSVDGTVDVLEQYRQAGVLEWRTETSQSYDQAGWVTLMARRAAEVHHADWVINADADEFWWPQDGESLARTPAMIPPEYGTVEAARENLIADPRLSGAWPDRLLLRDPLALRRRGGRVGTKTVHRADAAVQVAQGNHDVTGPSLGGRWPAFPITVLQVPDRGYPQFSRKVHNIGAGYASAAPTGGAGDLWREDYELLQRGELEAEWQRRQLTLDSLASRYAAGELVPDTRLRDQLHALLSRAVVPAALQAVLSRAS